MKIVVDANIALALVMPLAYSEQAHRQFAIWVKDSTELVAPTLWSYEVVASLRKAVATKWLTPERAESA
ncbi:MAG: hypothetical protein HY868_19005 [Chloroflexi bacterium]|nr:hypothetical protein [Chloroflexota bacterium]